LEVVRPKPPPKEEEFPEDDEAEEQAKATEWNQLISEIHM
jgi:hypothetical protein